MIKKIAWDAFKNTGDINTFLEFKQIENLEKSFNTMKQINLKNENQNIYNKNIDNSKKDFMEKQDIKGWNE